MIFTLEEQIRRASGWYQSLETDTIEGTIPHKVFYGMRCPVKLDFKSKPKNGALLRDGLKFPLRYNGRLVYALPGGKELVE